MDKQACAEARSGGTACAQARSGGRREIGKDQLERYGLVKLLQLLEEDKSEDLRVLRLKHYLDADANTTTISRVLSALEHCKTVEALYIHNFEEGMQDEQLMQLSRVLRNGRIWARGHPAACAFS